MKLPALGLLPGTRSASTCFLPRCDLLLVGQLGPWHPGQIFFGGYVPDFPIYSNGTKPGTLQIALSYERIFGWNITEKVIWLGS